MTGNRHPFSQQLDNISHQLYPLGSHPLAALPEEVRESYSLLLAATLGGNGTLDSAQARLLRSLLAALSVVREPVVLLNAAAQLQRDELFTALQCIRQAGQAETLLADALILSRTGAPLTAADQQMFAELAQALGVSDPALTRLVEWVQYLLFGRAGFSQPLKRQIIPKKRVKQVNLFGMTFPSTLHRQRDTVAAGQRVSKGERIASFTNTEKNRTEEHKSLIATGIIVRPAAGPQDIFVIEFPHALSAWQPLIDFPALLKHPDALEKAITDER